MAQCSPPPTYAPAFDHAFYTGSDPESFGGRCNFELGCMLTKYKDV